MEECCSYPLRDYDFVPWAPHPPRSHTFGTPHRKPVWSPGLPKGYSAIVKGGCFGLGLQRKSPPNPGTFGRLRQPPVTPTLAKPIDREWPAPGRPSIVNRGPKQGIEPRPIPGIRHPAGCRRTHPPGSPSPPYGTPHTANMREGTRQMSWQNADS
jgi:hypothetical protein